MVRSARNRPSRHIRTGAGLASCAVALAGLTACQTTQQTAAMRAIDSQRQRSDDFRVRVTEENPQVQVVRTDLVTSKKGTAIAVDIRNAGSKPVNDLPITVGVLQGGKQVLLNEKPGSYWKNHAPAIGPGKTTTWVFATEDKLKGATKPFAKVGLPIKHPPTTATEALPVITVHQLGVEGKKGARSVKVSVHNTAPHPQYGMTVYAWATKGGRTVLAGRSGATDLSTGDTDTLTIDLIGDASPSAIRLSAPPTIFN